MRPVYTEYVSHCLRFYARYPKPVFNTIADKNNWTACENALKEFNESEREIVLAIYRESDTISDNIYKVARNSGIDQDSIWKLIKELERKVARQRGLL